VFVSQLGAEHVHVAYGRGIWCALAGVAAAVVALALAGRAAPGDDEPVARSWRRPRAAADDPVPDAPFELTVASAPPFTALADDRDNPGRAGR
jgi:hypothetical protein